MYVAAHQLPAKRTVHLIRKRVEIRLPGFVPTSVEGTIRESPLHARVATRTNIGCNNPSQIRSKQSHRSRMCWHPLPVPSALPMLPVAFAVRHHPLSTGYCVRLGSEVLRAALECCTFLYLLLFQAELNAPCPGFGLVCRDPIDPVEHALPIGFRLQTRSGDVGAE